MSIGVGFKPDIVGYFCDDCMFDCGADNLE